MDGRELGTEGQIIIEGLEVFAHHGVFEQEQKEGQTFYINAVLHTQTREAGLLDDLQLSVDYGAVCHFIDAFVKEYTWQLIETVAERLAEAVLLQFPRIERLQLEIRKPSAPIGLPFSSVSVCIARGWHTAYIALGSNMGDKKKYLEDAVKGLSAHRLLQVEEISDWIVTTPYGGVEQEDFLNGVLRAKTLLPPLELLHMMQELEQQAGRTREIHWGPRTLDLDLLFYDDAVIQAKELSVPHPDLQNRRFVLEPMCQLAPWHFHPALQKTMQELLSALK